MSTWVKARRAGALPGVLGGRDVAVPGPWRPVCLMDLVLPAGGIIESRVARDDGDRYADADGLCPRVCDPGIFAS